MLFMTWRESLSTLASKLLTRAWGNQGRYLGKISSELVYQGKDEFPRYRIQKDISHRGKTVPAPQNMFISTP